MNCIDFEYNGHKLSEFGCIVCRILTNANAEAKDIGNQIKFNIVNSRNENSSHKFQLLNSEYENVYSMSLEIGKSVSKNQKNMYFTDDEAIRMVRWLNQKKFHKLRMLDEDGQYPIVYYNGSFNVRPITLSNKTIGMSLDFMSDSPFGYYEPISHSMDFSVVFSSDSTLPPGSRLGEYILYDHSDEAGYIYPENVEIEILENGNLAIHNSLDDEDVIVNNCVSGEILTLNGKYKILTSNMGHPNLYNDFNYHFLKVINTYDECDENDSYSKNIFTVSLKCRISFSYSPIAKIGVI